IVRPLSGPLVKHSASFFMTARSLSRTFAELYAKRASVSVRPQALLISSEILMSDFAGSSPGFSELELSESAGAGSGLATSAGGAFLEHAARRPVANTRQRVLVAFCMG